MVDKAISPKDREAFISAFGNDTEMCDLLARIGRRLDETYWKGEASKYKREEKK